MVVVKGREKRIGMIKEKRLIYFRFYRLGIFTIFILLEISRLNAGRDYIVRGYE